MFKYITKDLAASIVVFFVALPLCMGIALASGAPPFAGIIAGIIGGIVVGSISGSSLGVSGPAAGLAIIVLGAIASLGSFEVFLLAVVIGGILQIVLGLLKAGVIAYYFPSAVIKGMLAGIGLIIFLKQIPHAFGYDEDYEGDINFNQADGENTFSEIINVIQDILPGALLITLVSLAILLLWEKVLANKFKIFTLIPGPFVAVLFGILFYSFTPEGSYFSIETSHLVNVPVPENIGDFFSQFSFPDFSAIGRVDVWIVAATIAAVASIETLLSVEASDKLDPDKRVTPTNRELIAQGIGNMFSGLIGGLPITQVIVRSSANVQAGGKTKLSSIIHGFLLLFSVMLIPVVLNLIPKAVLAAVLLLVGYKLAKPALFKKMWKLGWEQFVPFIVTVLGLVFTDLLIGVGLGLVVGIITILWRNYNNSHFLHKEVMADQKNYKITLSEEVTFLNKGAIIRELNNLPENITLEMDVRNTIYLAHDVVELLDDFSIKAKDRNIDIKLVSERGIVMNPTNYEQFFRQEKLIS